MFSALTDYENRFKSIEQKVNNITQLLLTQNRLLLEIRTGIRVVRRSTESVDHIRQRITDMVLDYEEKHEEKQDV